MLAILASSLWLDMNYGVFRMGLCSSKISTFPMSSRLSAHWTCDLMHRVSTCDMLKTCDMNLQFPILECNVL
jgi:hypothetical protein